MGETTIHRLRGAVLWSARKPDLARQWAAGTVIRLRAGLYVDSDLWRKSPEHERFRLAAIAKALRSPETTFCCETALQLADVPVLGVPRRLHEVAKNPSRTGSQASVPHVLARAGDGVELPHPPAVVRHLHGPCDVVNDGGIRRLTTLDAAVDVLSTASFQRGLVVADAILRAPRSIGALPCGHAPHVELFDGSPPPSGSEAVCAVQVMARRLHERTPAASRRRRALLALRHASPLAESPGESASRAILLAAGFPTPVLQAELRDHQGFIGRPDFWWPQQRIIGEFDGIAKYTDAGMTQGRSASSIIRAEKVREARLMALSNRLFRWEWGDVMHPERLVAKALAVGLEADPRRRFPGSGVPSRSL